MGDFRAGKFDISRRELQEIVDDSPEFDAWAEKKLSEIEATAIAIFQAEEVKGPQHESWTTPPKYIESFERRRFGNRWRLYNTDPNGIWVEFGAHSGEHHDIPILRYRPLGRAIQIVGGLP